MASRIVESVLEEARRRDAKKVLKVHLTVGDLTFLSVEQLEFCYETLAKGSILEGSRLTIERRGAEVECSRCGYKGPIKCVEEPPLHLSFPSLNCPKCTEPVKVLSGRECIIERIEMKA